MVLGVMYSIFLSFFIFSEINKSGLLGYTDLSNYFRSLVIDWLSDLKNEKLIKNELTQYFNIKKSSNDPINEFVIKLARDIAVLTNCVVELYVLSRINRIPIVVYNDDNIPIYIFDKGIVYDHKKDKKIPDNYVKYIKTENKNVINIKFSYITNDKIPEEIGTIYFKSDM